MGTCTSDTWRRAAFAAVLLVTSACSPASVTDDAVGTAVQAASAAAEATELETAEFAAAVREAADRAEREAADRAEREAAERAEREAEATGRAAAEAAEREAAEAAERAAAATWVVTNVADGDTVDVRKPDGTEGRVRVIGIDTPERGECGFGEATAAMERLVLDRPVDLVAGARDDRDRYGRILRYLDIDGTDAGLTMIEDVLAIARYDSRDGYGRHDREEVYMAADARVEHLCGVTSGGGSSGGTSSGGAAGSGTVGGAAGGPGSRPDGAWRNCTEARDAGAAPVLEGTPRYGPHLDRDRDGVGCE